jgi:hypothetical protein
VRVKGPLLAAAIAAAALPVACGDGDGLEGGDLAWVREPKVFREPDLPRDRVLVGTVRNDSLRRLKIVAGDVRAVDEDGTALRGNATFIKGYIHALYPPTRPPPGGLPESELERLGKAVRLDPGGTAPLSIAWRVPRGAKGPVRIDYGAGFLPIPGH